MQVYVPRFGFLLDDLSRISQEQLLNRKLTPSARVTLLALQTAPGNPQITALLRRWEDQLRAVLDQPGGGEAFLAILTYIQHVRETASRMTWPPRSARMQGRRT